MKKLRADCEVARLSFWWGISQVCSFAGLSIDVAGPVQDRVFLTH